MSLYKSAKFLFLMVAVLQLSVALGQDKTVAPKPAAPAPAAPVKGAPATSVAPPTPAQLAVFPPEMQAELKLDDPSWATLAPPEQVHAIRKRLESLAKGDASQPALQLTLAWLLDQRVPEARLEAAAEYLKLQSLAMADPGYKFAGQAQLRGSEVYYELAKTNKEAGFEKRGRTAIDSVVRAEQRRGGKLPLWHIENGRWVAATDPYGYALWRWDSLSHGQTMYKLLDRLVGLVGGRRHGDTKDPLGSSVKSGASQVLALLLLALTLNVLTFPLSRKSYRSMREMQRIQPLVQEVQKRNKDNPKKSQEEMMRIYREHGVNPMAGCLPMIIQMPIFIFVYQGVWAFTFNFYNSHFLWIKSLADPDVNLLVLYGISMYVSQKIMMAGQPVSDPMAAQQQRTMSILMPVMFTYMMYLWRLPSAFYFYWMAFNVFSTSGQLLNRRAMAAAEAAAGLTVPQASSAAASSSAGGTTPAKTGPPALRPAGRAAGKGKRK